MIKSENREIEWQSHFWNGFSLPAVQFITVRGNNWRPGQNQKKLIFPKVATNLKGTFVMIRWCAWIPVWVNLSGRTRQSHQIHCDKIWTRQDRCVNNRQRYVAKLQTSKRFFCSPRCLIHLPAASISKPLTKFRNTYKMFFLERFSQERRRECQQLHRNLMTIVPLPAKWENGIGVSLAADQKRANISFSLAMFFSIHTARSQETATSRKICPKLHFLLNIFHLKLGKCPTKPTYMWGQKSPQQKKEMQQFYALWTKITTILWPGYVLRFRCSIFMSMNEMVSLMEISDLPGFWSCEADSCASRDSHSPWALMDALLLTCTLQNT